MRIEFQRGQSLTPHTNVRMGKQKVCSETEQPAHGIGLLLQHRTIELSGCDVIPAGWPKRPFGKTQCRGELTGREPILSRDGVYRRRGEHHVAASRVEGAGG